MNKKFQVSMTCASNVHRMIQTIGRRMRFKVIYVSLIVACLSALPLRAVYASVSPNRTYAVLFDNGIGRVIAWNLTAPVYASPGSPVNFTWNYEQLAGTFIVTSLKLEVTAMLDGGGKQQIYYSILLQGTYNAGYKLTVTPIVTIPSNAMLGSALNVSLYTSLNKWFLFPTEIRTLNYDDLQSQTSSLQSQVTSLQSQVDTLTSDKTSLQSQVDTLTSDKTSLQSQVSNLQSQVDTLQSQIKSITYLAVGAAIVLACTTVYFATRKPKSKGT